MTLSRFIRQHGEEIVQYWCSKVSDRLELEKPQLINDIPELLVDLARGLKMDPQQWSLARARAHARQRIAVGVDIGGLSEEIGILGEAILELAGERGVTLDARETARMLRLLARGTAASVEEYARLRDRELNKQSAEHFSFVAHELRTPLWSATIAVEMLAHEAESPLVGRLRRALAQLSSLVDNTLVEARLAAEPPVRKEIVSGCELAEAAVKSAELAAEERQVDLCLDVEDFDVEVDRRLMVSALTNLIINGVKFSHRGGKVFIRGSAGQEQVCLEVEDSCGGLPGEVAPKLFQPFGQSGKDRSGFGLGLFIVKQAAEAHGGSVRVVSHAGDGCCFVLELPRRSGA